MSQLTKTSGHLYYCTQFMAKKKTKGK